MTFLTNLSEYLLPPRIKVLVRGLLSAVIGFIQVDTWADAVRTAYGYQDPGVITSALSAHGEVHDHKLATHVDARTLQIAAALSKLCTNWSSDLTVRILDIGGADGRHERLIRPLLHGLNFEWTVLETAGMVENLGRLPADTNRLTWITDISQYVGSADVVLMSSVLQYVEKPYELLEEASKRGRFLLINRLPLIDSDDDVPTVQHLRMYGHRGSYPAWFLSRRRLLGCVEELGEVLMTWDVPEDRPVLHFREVGTQGLLIKCAG